jgi:hypothetical protein
MPQSNAGIKALAECKRLRRRGAVLSTLALQMARNPEISPHVMIAEALDRNYAIKAVGSNAAALLGAAHGTLQTAGNRRLAARLRRAFDYASAYGDPVAFQFSLRARRNSAIAAELFVIPLKTPRSKIRRLLGVLASRHGGKGWEP